MLNSTAPNRQSGVIPWRYRFNGDVEIALVTTSSGRNWVVPKGNVPRRLTPRAAARREAFEEAGVLGPVGECVGAYGYRKRRERREVAVYAMEVRMVLPVWPEMLRRTRAWLTVDEAADMVPHAGLAECIRQLGTQGLVAG